MTDIDAIRKLADAATRGPWECHPDGLVWADRLGDPVSGSTELEDAKFIAAARTVVPALCDEVDQLRADNQRLRADNQRLRDGIKATADGIDLAIADTDNPRMTAEHRRGLECISHVLLDLLGEGIQADQHEDAEWVAAAAAAQTAKTVGVVA